MEEKIAEPKTICVHPEHNPPSHLVLSPGTYKHVCPGCGEVIIYEVPQITF